MDSVQIILRSADFDIEYQMRLSHSVIVSEFRENAQTLAGYDDQVCRLILARTQSDLPDSMPVSNSGIRSGDVLLVVPIDRQSKKSNQPLTYRQNRLDAIEDALRTAELKVTYALIASISDGAQYQRYEIQLISTYEDDPYRFFEKTNGRERQNLEVFLQGLLLRNPLATEVDDIINLWCNEIKVGHKITKIMLSPYS